jgi:hypothetical protein
MVGTRRDKCGILRRIGCGVTSAVLLAGCELDNAATPHVIAGPTVASPTPLHAPYVWDTPEDLRVWTENTVSRGAFVIDDADSNGAIASQFTGRISERLILRSPDIDPPAQSIRAVRVRYQWVPSGISNPELWLIVAFEAANAPRRDVQPSARITLKTGPGWKEAESVRMDYPELTSLDVRYVYFSATPNRGLLKIDSIALVDE